ncbi:ead/Ea22-like family protein [Enterobacter roggenkampii]|uniref:ead/Ea22-like family protein n=1 Tax=Enterobacter roggenkampii TaxID=1812935 RepID=UPI001BE0E7E1|nr:ead/Ea22-like family protein [Enterobacter roggenkampii]MBT1814114.1 ead/Ea22-like family protein [Enterobacter roggenkampii]
MSNIDKRELRKAAMHAKTMDDWGCDADNFHDKATPDAVLALLDELEAKGKQIAELQAMLARLYAECDTGERRGNGSQSGVAMPSWVTVEAARLLLGVK